MCGFKGNCIWTDSWGETAGVAPASGGIFQVKRMTSPRRRPPILVCAIPIFAIFGLCDFGSLKSHELKSHELKSHKLKSH